MSQHQNNNAAGQLSRRHVLTGGAGLLLAGCSGDADRLSSLLGGLPSFTPAGPRRDTAYYRRIYGPLPNEKFPLPRVRLSQLKPRYRRRIVKNRTGEKPGTVVVDTRTYHLYWTMPDDRAVRYGVGLGRAGFEWSGRAKVKWKQAWPKWTPPAEMIAREPQLAKWSADNGGMPPGLTNPLGARALYIFQGKQDTLYRLHGSPETWSIGKAVSSGCVRLVNQDVIDLYDRVPSGSPIVVI